MKRFTSALIAVSFVALGSLPAAAQTARVPQTRLADSLFRVNDRAGARRAYQQVLAADPDNSRATFQLGVLRRDEPAEAVRLFGRYVALEPDDPWGLMALGDALGREGKWREALAAYERARRLAPDEPEVAAGRDRLLNARAAASPWIETVAATSRDSDGNLGRRVSFVVGATVAPNASVALKGTAADTRDGVDLLGTSGVSGMLSWRPAPRTSVEAELGATRTPRLARAEHEWILPTGRARLRWAAPRARAALDVRVLRNVLDVGPVLIVNRVIQQDARATLDVRLAGPLGLRAGGRSGTLTDRVETNVRSAANFGPVIHLGEASNLSLQAAWMGFSRPSASGYFAPRGIQTVQASFYTEAERARWMFAADLQAGAQRVADYGADYGAWRQALGLYLLVGWRPAPQLQLRLELEGYDTATAPAAVTTANSWRYLALGMGARWSVF